MLTAEKGSLASIISRENSGSNQLQTLEEAAAIFAIDMAKWSPSIDRPNKLSEGRTFIILSS